MNCNIVYYKLDCAALKVSVCTAVIEFARFHISI